MTSSAKAMHSAYFKNISHAGTLHIMYMQGCNQDLQEYQELEE